MRAIGKPVAFEARAELRDTLGFISMTSIRPVVGWTANWMLHPPASTPISRMHAIAASRIAWYSRSESVSAGAIVIESPVWTPIASKFSIEHTMTTLSARSRITSSSNSFHPMMLRSMRTSPIGEERIPARTRSSNSSRLYAVLPPVPPSVKEGRMMAGNPVSSTSVSASSSERAKPPAGSSRPIRCMASANCSRSSASWIARTSAPMSSTPCSSSPPRSASSSATLSAVWPPIVGRSASGFSTSITRCTQSAVSGSM